MGLSDATSHVVWGIVVLSVLGMGAGTAFQQAETLDEARRAAEDQRLSRLMAARLPTGTFCYADVPDEVRFTGVNRGSLSIDVSKVALVIDGVPASVGEGVWSPSETRVLTVGGIVAEPDRVMLALPGGDLAYAEKTTCPVLTSIVVTPDPASLAIGEGRSFTAVGYDQFGVLFNGEPYTWSTAAGGLVTTSPSTVTLTAGNVSGTFTLTATSGTVNGSADVTIRPDAPSSIDVTPGIAGVGAGGTAAFTAVATDAYGNVNATATISWSTNAGSITSGGVLTAQTTPAAGRNVTATTGAISDNATVDVVAAAVDTVTVAPAAPTLYLNRTQQFTATLRDQYGNVNSTAAVSWTATGGGVTSSGLFTAPSTAGSVTVTATSNGKTGIATVAVKREVHVDAMATYKDGVAASSFRKGVDTVEVRVTIKDMNGTLVQGANVTVQLIDANQQVAATLNGISDASGIASVSYAIPSSAPRPDWTANVTNVTGAELVYNSAANVVSSVGFTVTT